MAPSPRCWPRDGHDVEVTARGENLAAIQASGIRLTGGWGDFTAAVTAGEHARHTAPELAIVATKAQDARAAILANARLLNGVPVLVVQNGLEGVSADRARCSPGRTSLGGLAMYASSLVEPGHIAITTPGPHLHRRRCATCRRGTRQRAERRRCPPSSCDNFVGAQWTKLDRQPGQRAARDHRPQRAGGRRERRAASHPDPQHARERARRPCPGHPVRAAAGTQRPRDCGLFARTPLRLAESLPRLMARRMGATPNPGSTLQSIRRGALTEVDYLNGAVVDAARALGSHSTRQRRDRRAGARGGRHARLPDTRRGHRAGRLGRRAETKDEVADVGQKVLRTHVLGARSFVCDHPAAPTGRARGAAAIRPVGGPPRRNRPVGDARATPKLRTKWRMPAKTSYERTYRPQGPSFATTPLPQQEARGFRRRYVLSADPHDGIVLSGSARDAETKDEVADAGQNVLRNARIGRKVLRLRSPRCPNRARRA